MLVFFARSGVDRRVWNTRIAPALGLLGLLGCLVLTLGNFPTLIGGSTGLAVGIGAVLVLVTLAGVVVGVDPARDHSARRHPRERLMTTRSQPNRRTAP